LSPGEISRSTDYFRRDSFLLARVPRHDAAAFVPVSDSEADLSLI
jgi:hypothetical protein